MVAAAVGCGSPAAPTPPPPTPDPLKLTCPVNVSLTSPRGVPTSVHYGEATAEGGTRPVTIACTPANDSIFPLGASSVTCTGTDAKGVTATCSFGISVVGPPRISSTNFVAFGDSITAGEITVIGEGGIRIRTVQDALSYPTDLRASLVGRYTAQSIIVDNQGLKGETTSAGATRLPRILTGLYQVVLLLEGANDINAGTTASAADAVANIDTMIRTAKSRGLKVFVGTLPPQNPPPGCFSPCRTGGAALVPSFNSALKSIAAAEGVTVADIYAAFNGDLTLIGPDGLHPNANGYALIANTFFNAIKTALEVPPTSLAPFFTRPAVSPRRHS